MQNVARTRDSWRVRYRGPTRRMPWLRHAVIMASVDADFARGTAGQDRLTAEHEARIGEIEARHPRMVLSYHLERPWTWNTQGNPTTDEVIVHLESEVRRWTKISIDYTRCARVNTSERIQQIARDAPQKLARVEAQLFAAKAKRRYDNMRRLRELSAARRRQNRPTLEPVRLCRRPLSRARSSRRAHTVAAKKAASTSVDDPPGDHDRRPSLSRREVAS